MDNSAINLEHWKVREHYSLHEAAILLSGQDPTSPSAMIAPKYKIIAEELRRAVVNRLLLATAEYDLGEFEDDHGEIKQGLSLNESETLIEKSNLAKWARSKGLTPSFLEGPITDEPPAVPAHDYSTRLLQFQQRAIEKFWLNRQPHEKEPTTAQVTDWLMAEGIGSKNAAKAIDLIIRSDDHPHKAKSAIRTNLNNKKR